LFGCICTIMFWHLVIIWLYYQGFRVGSSRTLSVCFVVALFYIPGLHLKFMLPSNPHISDWHLINHDPFIHDPLLMNTNDPFLIFTFPFSITWQFTFTTIHFSPTLTDIQTKRIRGYMDYETANEKYSGPSPNPNNKAKPMTLNSN